MADQNAPSLLPRDAAPLRLAAEGGALCTLIGIDGPFSRALGAQFSVGADGSSAGDMTGGCLDRALADECAKARESGVRRLVRYGQGSPFIDIRLPCGGGLDILIDPRPVTQVCDAALDVLRSRRPATLAVPLPDVEEPMALVSWQSGDQSHRETSFFHRVYHPALRLHVLGGGPEAASLARLAGQYGIECFCHAPAGEGGGGSLYLGQPPAGVPTDAWTAIVLLFHDHDWEIPLIDWALGTPAFYIGALGGQRTAAMRKAALLAKGWPEAEVGRVRGPIGAFGPARDADSLALSVLAELVALYNALA